MINNNPTTIGIVGAGAMGCLFSYFFYRHYNVVAYESNHETVNAISNGLTIEFENTKQIIHLPISNTPDILSNADIIFIFVKSFATQHALKTIQQFIHPYTIVVTLQNGIGNAEIISAILNNPLVYGTTTFGATKIDHSHIRFGGSGSILIGSNSLYHCHIVASVLQKCGLQVTIAPNPDKAIWEKAIINAAINPLGALFEVPNGRLIQSHEITQLMTHIINEAVMVAIAHGIDINADDMIKTTITVCNNTRNNYCSMLQDILAKRKTEIDYINGAIISVAMKHSINLVYNATLYRLIKYKERLGMMSSES